MTAPERVAGHAAPDGDDVPKRNGWTIITGEYPPQPGGVSDFTAILARALAADAEEVDVWCPGQEPAPTDEDGVRVHRAMGAFAMSDLLEVQRKMPGYGGSRRVLVQWVPHAYGQRAMNLGVCLWIWWRSVRQRDRVELIVHETFLEFSSGWKQRAVALVHRLMTVILFRAVVRIWVTVPGWATRLRPFLLSRRVPFQWLPVPSGVPVVDEPALTDATRTALGGRDAVRVGHFGTYGKHVVALLRPLIRELLARDPRIVVVLMGRGSTSFRQALVDEAPEFAPRIAATGGLPAESLSIHLRACDIMLQPFPDGVSSRRSSAMAGIAHGVPLLTTRGNQTEPVWEGVAGVALVDVDDAMDGVPAVLRWAADAELRRVAGATVRDLYAREFSLERMLSRLRSPTAAVSPDPSR